MQKKTAFMVLNCKQVDLPDADCIRIGQDYKSFRLKIKYTIQFNSIQSLVSNV